MKIFKHKCGSDNHKFEPRFDEKPHGAPVANYEGPAGGLRGALYYKVYVKDVCRFCGKEIKR